MQTVTTCTSAWLPRTPLWTAKANYLSTYLSIYLSIYLSGQQKPIIYLPIYLDSKSQLSIYPSIYLSGQQVQSIINEAQNLDGNEINAYFEFLCMIGLSFYYFCPTG